MLQRADAAFSAVIVQGIPAAVLRERLGSTNTGRARAEHLFHRVVFGQHHVVLVQRLRQRQAKHVFHVTVQQPGAIQLAEDTDDATRAMHVFHMVLLGTRCDLTQLRHFTGEPVDVAHGEVDFGFLRGGQQVQNGVGGTAHGDVQGHGVLERRFAGDAARQRAGVVLLVVALSQFNDAFTGVEEQLLTVGMGRQQRAVARLRQTQRFGQAVHGVRREHTGTGAAGRARGALHLVTLLVRDFRVRALDHRIDQVELDDFVGELGFPRFHRAAGDEDHRNVQAQGGHQHPRGDFVAVGDTDHRIGAVGVNHVLYRVGDQLARRE